MSSDPSQIAGRYTVDRAVGRGGAGTVWLCRDEVLGRQVAVKGVGNLPGESASDLDRALREARTAAGLTHPHVVSVFDAVEDGGRTYLVMEYVPSRTLGELLDAEGPLDPQRVAGLGAQAADGLAAAHARGVVHRDVKPGNLLVTDDDRVKITDFGIALVTGDPRLTQTGMVVGTPAYFSPEAARGEEPGPASDVWSLGATLYEAVEGRPPYADRGNALALLVAIASEEAPPPHRAGALAEPIAAMMRRDPADRPTMAEVARQLTAVATVAPVETAANDVGPAGAATAVLPHVVDTPADPLPAGPLGPPPVAPARDEPRRRPWLLPVAAVLLLLLAVGGVGIALATRGDDTPTADPTPGDGADRRPGRNASTGPSTGPSTEPTSDPAPETSAPPPDPSTEESEPDEEESEESEEESEEPEDGGAASGDPAAFAETYYGYLPDDTGSAYQLLSSDYRAGMSPSDYEGFWSTIDDVDVSGVEVVDDSTVDVTLTYTTDVSSQTETRRLYLTEADGGLVIADDEIV